MHFRQIAQRVGLAVLWAYTLVRDGLDWVGRATLFEDTGHTLGVVKHGLNWLFSTPWWAATSLAVIATVMLFWPNIRRFLNEPVPNGLPNVTPTKDAADDGTVRGHLKDVAASGATIPRIELSAAVVGAQEGMFPAKYIQVAVHARGNLLGCQVTLNEVAKVTGNAIAVVYSQPLHAGWSGTSETVVDVNDGQELRANLFSVSMDLNLQRYALIPQTRHRDEALRLAVTAPGFYRLTVLASSKTSAPEKKTFMLRWRGSFDDVEFREGSNTWADDKISLFEAATRAHEQLRHKPVAIFAEGMADSDDDILTWYCCAMAMTQDGKPPLVVVHGNRPPSRIIETIDIRLFNNYDFVADKGVIILQERMGKRRFENLSVPENELASAIEEMGRWQA